MTRPNFYFLEPSKVGSQHLTLIEGYLGALAASEWVRQHYQLVLKASSATLAALPRDLKAQFRCERVQVMDPERRRLVLKTFVELYVVLRSVSRLRANDILFVSCLLPTTLWLMEKCTNLFSKKRLQVVLHGEIEGLFDSALQRPTSYGYWSLRWLKARQLCSCIDLIVIDDFIKAKLIEDFPDKFADHSITVVPHPIIWDGVEAAGDAALVPAVCFVGYRSRFKGYDEFLRLAKDHPEITFLAIGAGKVENVHDGSSYPIFDNDVYLGELSKCAAAIFPYSRLYNCSLSAAAMDALSVGVKIIAYKRPCFVGLAESFGPDSVVVCESYADLSATMVAQQLVSDCHSRSERLERLSNSKYSLPAVGRAFERMLEPMQLEAVTLEVGEE